MGMRNKSRKWRGLEGRRQLNQAYFTEVGEKRKGEAITITANYLIYEFMAVSDNRWKVGPNKGSAEVERRIFK